MTDEVTPQDGNGEEQAQGQDSGAQDNGKTDAELRRARDDAAKYRTQLRELQKEMEGLKPLADKAREMEEAQKTTEQKLSEKLAAMEAEVARVRQEAETTAKRGNLFKLATKAGVDPDLVDLLDITKIPLDDEAAAAKLLQQFAANRPGGGSGSNPGRDGAASQQDREAEWRDRYFGGGANRTTIFGG